MITERRWTDRLADLIIFAVLTLLALACVIPFIHIIAISLSGRSAIAADAVGLLPVDFSWDNYTFIFRNDQILRNFGISAARVVLGVATTLILVVLTSYPLSLDYIRMPGRGVFKIFMLIGLLFNGGLIPVFLSFRNLGLIDNFLVLILPLALNIFYVIVMTNFFRGIPRELAEAAWIDGASHLTVLTRVYLPVSLPALATIALFAAVTHWNSWFDGIIFIRQTSDWPLQSFLYSMISTNQIQANASSAALQLQNATPEGLSATLIVVAALPIMLVYPFVQRYFVRGLTLGSVKS